MANNHQELVDVGDNDIFVYTGGEVPHDVKRAKIDESIDTIPRDAFQDCEQLTEVEGHSKLKKIKDDAFYRCRRWKRLMKMSGVKEIERWAFYGCNDLSDFEFDKLEVIGYGTFNGCKSLSSINLPSVRRIEEHAFDDCTALTDAVFSEDLEGIRWNAFLDCPALRRIAIPLKDGLIVADDTFNRCASLSRIDIVGGIHKTISSLHMKSWRDEMREEIDRINQTLPDSPYNKTAAIRHWIRSVLDRMEHYKAEHQILLKEAMTLLELALWKAELGDNGSNNIDAERVEVVRIRKQHRVTCGANIGSRMCCLFLY